MRNSALKFVILLASLSSNVQAEPSSSPLTERDAIAALKKSAPASNSNYDAQAYAAYQREWTRFNQGTWPETADAALEILKAAEAKRLPAVNGPDHDFNALADLLAEYARIKAQHSPLKEQGLWSFVAGEAEFAFSNSGVADYKNFLSKHLLPDDDERVARARARITRIQKVDEGLSR